MRLKDLYYFDPDDLHPRFWVVDGNVAHHIRQPLVVRYSEILDRYNLLVNINGCSIRVKIPWWLSMKYRRLFSRIFKYSPRHPYACCLQTKKDCQTSEEIKKTLNKEYLFMYYYSELVSEERYLAWLQLSKLQVSTETFCKFIRESIANVKDVTLDDGRCTIHFDEMSEICGVIHDADLFSRFEKDITTDISITLPHFVRNK